jgi:trigger factor
VTVKDIKVKVLPEVDDDLAAEAGFDSLDELRADLTERLRGAAEQAVDEHFRRDVLEAITDAAKVDLPEEMVDRRVDNDLHRLEHELSERGISLETYRQATGQDEAAIRAGMREGATSALRQELALMAVVDQAGLEVSDEDLTAELESELAGARNAKQLRKRVRREGIDEQVRRQMLLRRALDHAVEAVKATELDEGASAEKLFPESAETAGQAA